MRKIVFTKNNYEYRYITTYYTDTIKDYAMQKIICGKPYHSYFKTDKDTARKEMTKILSAFSKAVYQDIVRGATVDFNKFEIGIDKRRTNKKTSTVFSNVLYVPTIKYKGLVRLKNVMHDIKPHIEMQIGIRKSYKNNNYENL